jgi:hypothetical protein
MFKMTLAETEAPGEAPSRAEMEKSLRLTKGGASDLIFAWTGNARSVSGFWFSRAAYLFLWEDLPP